MAFFFSFIFADLYRLSVHCGTKTEGRRLMDGAIFENNALMTHQELKGAKS